MNTATTQSESSEEVATDAEAGEASETARLDGVSPGRSHGPLHVTDRRVVARPSVGPGTRTRRKKLLLELRLDVQVRTWF